jgi:hypothetical protein
MSGLNAYWTILAVEDAPRASIDLPSAKPPPTERNAAHQKEKHQKANHLSILFGSFTTCRTPIQSPTRRESLHRDPHLADSRTPPLGGERPSPAPTNSMRKKTDVVTSQNSGFNHVGLLRNRPVASSDMPFI